MKLESELQCDVLIVGSGIAGLQAADAASEKGARVILISQGELFSGASFYPGTWGFGLIAPDGENDKKDLAESIQIVGEGMADPLLVEAFVNGIDPGIESLRRNGLIPMEARDKQQSEFIPCFDRKHRHWMGLSKEAIKIFFGKRLMDKNVRILSNTVLLDLTEIGQRIDGAIVYHQKRIMWIKSGSVVLATGGLSGLYQSRLTTEDVSSFCHWVALKVGAQAVNLEFQQFMPGYIEPAFGTVFNEKAFQWSELLNANGETLFDENRDLYTRRSTHGPFTYSLGDYGIDFAILSERYHGGIRLRYRSDIEKNMPEFSKTYFEWLHQKYGMTVKDIIKIGMFAHASNGGICIDSYGYTGVPGLYAAGEITGGMHGANRIGGLSTANGIVFGKAAGEYAAQSGKLSSRGYVIVEPKGNDNVLEITRKIREIMDTSSFPKRNQHDLNQGIAEMERLKERLRCGCGQGTGSKSDEICGKTQVAQAQINTALCVLKAELLREESRGSHFRMDYPDKNVNMNFPIRIRAVNGEVEAWFDKTVRR